MNYKFQIEEVSGMVMIELESFEELWLEKIDSIQAKGIVLNENLKVVHLDSLVIKGDFLPHDSSYISTVLNKIKEILV
ncbi:hypothetical protein [Robertmurraya korlensis]|uniref:hypothetical protein n=1 Tax=Robertmurraya korlensis TaxID=519977 RepID=UPI000824B72E|nr:hypothetical protein [Robertmurraya korlensis]